MLPGGSALIIHTSFSGHPRGSFQKIVKRGPKLTVEKFGGGASLVLFPALTQCLQVPRGRRDSGKDALLAPPK